MFFIDLPLSVLRSTSTVGFPRESRISLATMLTMDMLKVDDKEYVYEQNRLRLWLLWALFQIMLSE